MAVALTVYAGIYLLCCIRWWHIAPDVIASDATPSDIGRARGKAIGLLLAWPVIFTAASAMACWKVAKEGQWPT